MQVDIDHVLAATAEFFGGNEVLKQMCDNLSTQCQLFLAAVLVQMQCTGAHTDVPFTSLPGLPLVQRH